MTAGKNQGAIGPRVERKGKETKQRRICIKKCGKNDLTKTAQPCCWQPRNISTSQKKKKRRERRRVIGLRKHK